MRKIKLIITTLLFVSLLSLNVWAQQDNLIDEMQLLSRSEQQSLKQLIQDTKTKTNLDIVIYTTDALSIQPAELAAANYYEEHNYGLNESKDGIILLIALNERDYAIATHGVAIEIFSDNTLAKIENSFLPDLSKGNYYAAFSTFVSDVDHYVTIDREGKIVTMSDRWLYFGIGALVVILITIATIIILIRQLNTAKLMKTSANYIVDDSFKLSKHHDYFVTSHTSVVKKPEPKSGNGGSSTFTSSGGSTFGGSSGKF